MKKKKVCEMANCTAPFYARNLCRSHYQKLKRGTLHVQKEVKLPKICIEKGCDEKPLARDLCKKHYNMFNRKRYMLKYKSARQKVIDNLG